MCRHLGRELIYFERARGCGADCSYPVLRARAGGGTQNREIFREILAGRGLVILGGDVGGAQYFFYPARLIQVEFQK